MDAIDVGMVLVALIAAAGAWASQRAAARATTTSAETSGRLNAEEEAYVRARAMDIQTMQRQDEEINELKELNTLLRSERDQLKRDLEQLQREMTQMYIRLSRLEGPARDWERPNDV